MKTIVVCSGGLDSVTLAYKVAVEHKLHSLISFDYGQRHKKELDFAARTARDLGVRHHIVDLTPVGALLSGSSLTSDEIDVPDGHYAEETMRVTVVPNRNAIMLSVAFGAAASAGADAVATAVHGGDHFIYPDCRPDFINAFQTMQNHALEGVGDVSLYTPFVKVSKADIAAEAGRLGVPVDLTWSCYKGGETHCGRCGTCVERREALELARVKDTTVYVDRDYWKQARADHMARKFAKGETKATSSAAE
ncbi:MULTISPECIES: 7-cyano-7-deazaguanine synthase QueC [unclassified Thalassospira]|uniref:7-cyano-7-deazaguanine synthase QueC n=1 Tax=unclassified Thalassospira TaxID=2648997 RepID=UPI000EBE93B9|nr:MULTISPECIES: 7-cyano-7-deazaguanine synthase QueC [unclassified Thalassospira]HAI29945.1 7-cyano-7-deazaguanine synthase QueC [Thalassospira sp.]|tara:strand:- start:1014 stop:1763 length:750 start_codon:yes stop_codon:yes gene_type:complete